MLHIHHSSPWKYTRCDWKLPCWWRHSRLLSVWQRIFMLSSGEIIYHFLVKSNFHSKITSVFVNNGPFQHETDWGSQNSVEFTTCKDSCTEFGCNNKEPEVKLGEKCYVCSLTLDAQDCIENSLPSSTKNILNLSFIAWT